MVGIDAAALPLEPLVTPSLKRRMACWLYEGMLLFAVVFVSGWFFSTFGQMRDAMDSRRHLLQGFLFIIFGIYFTYFWSKGQSLAMKTWNIRVVGADGKAISQLRAMWRYALSWLWFLPPLAAVQPFHLSAGEVMVIVLGWVAIWALMSRFQPGGQFPHDVLAGTRLVSSQPMSR